MGDMSLVLSSEFFGHMCTCAAENKFRLHFDWIFLKFPFASFFVKKIFSKSIAYPNGLYHTCLSDTSVVDIDTCIDDNDF